MRLITIPLSHYCDRARWALERCGVEYREEQHLQLVHARHVRKAGSSGTSVPVLVTGHGTALFDSSDIVTFADRQAPPERKLYPEDPGARDQVLALEHELAAPYGVETRRWIYVEMFPYRKLMLRYNNARAPAWERGFLRASYPLAKRVAVKKFELTADAVERGRPVIESTLERIAARLDDGRRYLFGDRFTAADLTFAAMSAPLIVPAGHYGVPMPTLDELPTDLRRQVETFRAHPAGAFALRLYTQDRQDVSRE